MRRYRHVTSPGAARPSGAIVAGIVAGVAAVAAAVGAVAVRRRFDPHLVPRTAFGPALVATVRDGDGEPLRLLAVGGAVQSATYLGERRYDLPLEYYRAIDRVVREANLSSGDLLVLGGGGYAYPKHAIAHTDAASVDVVELDPAVTRIARRWFYLDDLVREFRTNQTDRLDLVRADALAYLQYSPKAYDVIVDDVFSAGTPAVLLVSPAGAAAAHARLRDGGLLVVNVVARDDDLSLLQMTAENLGREFASVHVVPCTDEALSDDDNYLVVATDGSYEFEGAIG